MKKSEQKCLSTTSKTYTNVKRQTADSVLCSCQSNRKYRLMNSDVSRCTFIIFKVVINLFVDETLKSLSNSSQINANKNSVSRNQKEIWNKKLKLNLLIVDIIISYKSIRQHCIRNDKRKSRNFFSLRQSQSKSNCMQIHCFLEVNSCFRFLFYINKYSYESEDKKCFLTAFKIHIENSIPQIWDKERNRRDSQTLTW